MVCIRCGCEEFHIIRTDRSKNASGKYSPRSDRRLYQCNSCDKMYWVECIMQSVHVYNPVALKSEFVDLSEYTDKWHAAEQKAHPHQQNLFGD